MTGKSSGKTPPHTSITDKRRKGQSQVQYLTFHPNHVFINFNFNHLNMTSEPPVTTSEPSVTTPGITNNIAPGATQITYYGNTVKSIKTMDIFPKNQF